MAPAWNWINLPGGHVEEPVVDLCACTEEHVCQSTLSPQGAGLGRGCVVVQTNATSAFHVIFGHEEAPSRNTDQPVLRFVVGKRRNSMTSVGFGNPYLKKEPVDLTRSPDALLTDDPEKSRTYWFMYDRTVGVAAMGTLGAPQADLCRLVCRFRDAVGFRAEVCEGLRYVSVSSGRRAVSLRVVGAGAPPDVSIPRFRFDPASWTRLPWQGASCVFEPSERHRALLVQAQAILAASPIAPLYCLVEPRCLCVNPYRLLDPHRREELLAGDGAEDSGGLDWEQCHEEVHRRLSPLILASAPWTYWPLKFDRADCTTISLTPEGPGCSAMIADWCKHVEAAAGLRNSACSLRDMLGIVFAFEVFPVEGENAAAVRREVVREITALLQREWGTAELRHPRLATWTTHTEYDLHGPPPADSG